MDKKLSDMMSDGISIMALSDYGLQQLRELESSCLKGKLNRNECINELKMMNDKKIIKISSGLRLGKMNYYED